VIYKNRLIFLFSVIAFLALTYAASFIFSPENMNTKSSLYTWLDPKMEGKINRIVISKGDTNLLMKEYPDMFDIGIEEILSSLDIELIKKGNKWFVFNNGREYPARQHRIEDFIKIFSKSSPWPVRSTNASSHARFGLDGSMSSRITVYSENAVLMDILLGNEDNGGKEIFMRRYGENEVRSGDSIASSYLSNSISSWYELRLFPETENGLLDVSSVQRISVYRENETLIFSRQNREWIASGFGLVSPGQAQIENYIHAVLNAEGDDFISYVNTNDPALDYNSIIIEFGDGSVKTIRISAPNETNTRIANVRNAGNSEYIYSIPLWTAVRILKDASSFEMQ